MYDDLKREGYNTGRQRIVSGLSVGSLVSGIDMRGLSLMERKALVLWLMSRQRREDSKTREMTDDEYREMLLSRYVDETIQGEVLDEALTKYPDLFSDEEDKSLVSVVDYYAMTDARFEKYVRRLLGVKALKKGQGHDGVFDIRNQEWALEVKTPRISKPHVSTFIGDMTACKNTRGLMVTRYLGSPTPPACSEIEIINMQGQLYIEVRHVSELLTRRGIREEE